MIKENGERLNIMRKAFEKFDSMSINDFIDEYLYAQGEIKFQIYGVDFKLIDECLNLNDMIDYDFVGIDEHLKLSLVILEKYTGLGIPYSGQIKKDSKILHKCDYRYDELEALLESDVEKYITCLESLAHLGREY